MKYIAAVFTGLTYVAGTYGSWLLLGICAAILGAIYAHLEEGAMNAKSLD